MIIRKATLEDLPQLMEIFAAAKAIMRDSGNHKQWNGTYPTEDIVKMDIATGVCHVACDDNGVVATMSFIPGPDPTYAVIHEGSWPDDREYHVIHRIAVSAPGKGIARKMLDWAFEHADTIRIDTHRDNCIMHHILRGYGFVPCGVIYLANGDPRDAYHMTKCGQ